MNKQKLLFTSVFLFFYTSVLLIAQSAEPIYVDKSKFNSKGWQLVESGEDGSKIYFYFQNNTYTKAKIVYNSGREEPLELKTQSPNSNSDKSKKGKSGSSKPKKNGPLSDQWPTVCKPHSTQTDTWICRSVMTK